MAKVDVGTTVRSPPPLPQRPAENLIELPQAESATLPRSQHPIDEIKRPEPAQQWTPPSEVRRVTSLGALELELPPPPRPPNNLHRSFSLGATQGAKVRAPSVIRSAMLSEEDSSTLSSPTKFKKSPSNRKITELREPSSSNPPSRPSTAPSSRRSSATHSRASVTNELGDSVAESAVALLSAGDEDSAQAVANKKRNADFHDLFPALPRNELLVEDYSCAWQKEVLIQGRMYISQRHINFYANILGWVHAVEIPMEDIISVEKKNVAGIIPNSIEITTVANKYFFASFLHRESSYNLIKGLWEGVAHKSFQLRTIKNLSDPDLDDEYGREVEVPDEMGGQTIVSLDSLQERLRMGGEWVSKRASVRGSERTSEVKEREVLRRDEVETDMVANAPVDELLDAFGELTAAEEPVKNISEEIVKEQGANVLEQKVDSGIATEPPATVLSEIESGPPPLPSRPPEAEPRPLTPETNLLGLAEIVQSISPLPSSPTDHSAPENKESSPHSPAPRNQHIIHQAHPIRIHSSSHIHFAHHKADKKAPHGKKSRRPKLPKTFAHKSQPPVTCPCGPEHERLTSVLDTVFDCSVTRLWELMYNYAETQNGFLRKLLERRKNREFKFRDWVPPDVELPDPTNDEPKPESVSYDSIKKGWQRKLEYIVPLSGPIGPKQTRCKLHETVLHKDGNRSICILQISQTPDVPSGGSFQSRVKLCLTSVAHNRTRLRVSCEVEWLKSSWIRGPINSAVPEGLKEYHKDLESAVREFAKTDERNNSVEVEEVEEGSEAEDVEEDDTQSFTTTTSIEAISSASPGSSTHPLEKELAELSQSTTVYRHRHGWGLAQAPHRELCSGSPGLRFTTASEGTTVKAFVKPKNKKKLGLKDVKRAIGVLMRAAMESWGFTLVAALLFGWAWTVFLRWVVRREVARLLNEGGLIR